RRRRARASRPTHSPGRGSFSIRCSATPSASPVSATCRLPCRWSSTPAGRRLARNQLLAESAVTLGPMDRDGRLVALGHLPIETLPPGSYDLQVTVSEG